MQEFREQVLAWAQILGPNIYLQASVMLLAFIGIGKIIELTLGQILGKLVSRSDSHIDDELVGALQRPVFVTFTLIGFAAATRLLELPSGPTTVTIALLRTIAIAVWYGFLGTAARIVLQAISSSGRASRAFLSMLPLIETVVRVLLIALAIYFIFLAWSIDVTAWLASAGIIGLALSFAAKDTLSNLFAGVSLAADAPYAKGDYIILESGERGKVTHIGLRSTRILTRDDVEITIPNGIIGNGKIINEAGGPSPKHRIRIAVGVKYGSNIDQVIDAMNGIAVDHDEICKQPEPRVRFRMFGESSLDFELLCWIDRPVDRGRLLHELNCALYKRFAKDGIEIPFPQRDLYIKSMPTTDG